MSKWSKVRLGDLTHVLSGFAYESERFGSVGDIPIVRIRDVLPGTSSTYYCGKIDEKYIVRNGDILIGMDGKFSCARWNGGDALLNQRVCRIIPSGSDLEKNYLFYFLPAALGNIEDVTPFVTVKHLSVKQIGDIRMPLPSLSEQRRIAAILDKADALRVKRRAALAQLDGLVQAIFLDMFGDPIANSGGWPKQRLCSIGTLDRGVSKHRPRNAAELLGGPYPFIQTGDVANCKGYIRSFSSTYSDAGLRQSRMWPAGTLCITIAANIAKTGVLTFAACFPDSIVGFNSDELATVEYVCVLLSFLQTSLEERAPESAQRNINLEILRDLLVPVPDIGLQRKFAHRVAAVEKLKSGHFASLTELNVLFASLQHRAFRGEL